MVEFEAVSDANNPASPFEYDERPSHTVVLNSSLGGNFTVNNYADGDTIRLAPTEDGTVFSLVNVQDNFNCAALELDSTGTVNVSNGANTAIMFGDATYCFGDSTQIYATIIGGTSPYTLVYTDGTSNFTVPGYTSDSLLYVSPATTTTYTIVSVTDSGPAGCPTAASGISGDAVVTVQELPIVNASTVTQPSDCGASDGSIVVNLGNSPSGTIEYSNDGGINWQSSNTFSNLGTGIYNVVVRVDGACLVFDTSQNPISLAANEAPVYGSVNTTDPTECGTDDGTIVVQIQSYDQTQTLEYRLGTSGAFQTDSSFTGLAAGNYVVQVRYVGGTCQVTFPGGATINAISGPSFIITPVTTNVTDCAADDGTVSVSASAGSQGGIEYRLETSVGAQVFDWGSQNVFAGLDEGTYRALIRNNGGSCPDTSVNLTITEPENITFTSSTETDIVTCGATDGSISISAVGAAVEYSIDGGLTWQASSTFNNLGVGVYNAAIRNQADGSCLIISPAADTITAPADILMITPASTNVSDCGLTDASITAQVGSSDPAYTLNYSIDGASSAGPQVPALFSGLGSGTFNVKAFYEAASGVTCRDSLNVTITAPTAITINSIDSTDSPDCGVAGGEIQIHATGPDGSIEYSIDAGTSYQPNNVFSNLGDTTMTIQVRYTDQTCLNVYGQITLSVPVVTIVSIGDVTTTDPSACGVDDGEIKITPSQGDNHEYSLDGTTYQSVDSFTLLSGGAYVIYIRNSVTTSCNDTTSATLADNGAPELGAKVFLQGPFNTGTGLMGDGLRTSGVIPLTNPYDSAYLLSIGADPTTGSNGLTPYLGEVDRVNVGAFGTPIISSQDSATILGDNGSNSIVDWVAIELRPASDSTVITTRRVALLQRDGDLVEWSDGVTSLKFTETCATSSATFYVTIKHRNHLGVMTADPVDFSAGGAVSLDFTDGSVETYRKPNQIVDIEPQATVGGVRALWGGNVAFNRRILFQGDNPDASLIAKPVTESPSNPDGLANFILKGYYNSDVNMDGVTIFQGAPNDVDILFFNIMGNPSNTSFNANFTLAEQLPE